MSDARIIEGRYVDVRPIRTRKCLQITVEVPLELASEVTAKLGWPEPVNGTRCAVALLNDGASSAGGTDLNRGGADQPQDVRADGAPPAKLNSTRAVMMAKDPEFWRYLHDAKGILVNADWAADDTLKMLCGVKSKAELNDGRAAATFEAIRQDFYAWRRAA